jgi:hypothetical protein
VAQFEKVALVAKLRAARERKKAATGKCGGRKSYAERNAATVALAKKLARYPINGRKRSLRDVAPSLRRPAMSRSLELGTAPRRSLAWWRRTAHIGPLVGF